MRSWTGNNASISEVPEDGLPRLRRDHPPIVEEVGDAVDLAGEDVRELLGRP